MVASHTFSTDHIIQPGAHTRGGAAGLQPPPIPHNRNLKNTYFADIMISEVLRDFPFSRHQPLKSADDRYIRVLKNKLIKLKKRQEDRTL
jgi:hypothetical protein